MNYKENEVINVKKENLDTAADPESYIQGAVDAGEIIRDTTGVTINWKQKLSSRKLWCALISAVLGVVIAVFGEELGFIACIGIIALLFALVIRCFIIASKCRSKYGKYICIGVGAMILFQTFENVGMCIGVMPVTGIPLPFISYGGSSMITNMIGMGLVMSVAARQQTINFR